MNLCRSHRPTLAGYLKDIEEQRTPQISAAVAFHRMLTLVRNPRWQHVGRRIVHGNIKPDNLVVTRHPGRFVLIDFGSAWRAEESRQRDPGDGVNRRYAAPELIADYRQADFRWHQFSVSAIFYQLLTLKLPANEPGQRPSAGPLQPPSELSPDRDRLPRSI